MSISLSLSLSSTVNARLWQVTYGEMWEQRPVKRWRPPHGRQQSARYGRQPRQTWDENIITYTVTFRSNVILLSLKLMQGSQFFLLRNFLIPMTLNKKENSAFQFLQIESFRGVKCRETCDSFRSSVID